jgi:hypothetical protein
MAATEPDLLAVVEQSPRAAAAHDRAAWVGLFAGDGRVEDPVGSRPHIGPAQIGAFYDTFIGPRDIVFHRGLDIVRGSVVVRDLELEVTMDKAVTMRIPAFLRYDLHEVDGEWKFVALRAYWELPAMMRQFLRNGRRAVAPALRLSQGLLRNQRISGTVGFMTGFRPGVTRNKNQVARFVQAAGRADRAAVMQTLSCDAAVTFGDDDNAGLDELVEELAGASWAKMLAAGNTVTVSIDSGHRRGVLFADLTRRGDAVTRVRYFQAV